MHRLRFRQIHLDFHTSPHIPEVGVDFDRRDWQEQLRRGRVNSVTCFSKCHHGWSYHPTQVGQRHPHLKFDLLRAQFDASKEIGVNVPIYISAGLDNRVSALHPEWREITVEGRYAGWARNVTDAGFHKLCFNSPYLDYLCDQIREVAALYPNADGFFLDIISQGPCCCRWCLEVMEREGLNPEREEDRRRCAELALQRYYRETTAACRSARPGMPVFHNSGHVLRGRRELLEHFSHLELESLPTGGWGYDHFPLSAKYVSTLPLDFLGMTGKFHTTWGEFGGFKHPNALRYECAAMIALGAKCSVGDQLHPRGRLDPSTYALIGAAYAEVEAKEPWCENVTPVSEIGLLSVEAAQRRDREQDAPDVGATRLLLETHHLFDVLDPEADFNHYRLLILPDELTVDEALKRKLDAYLANGGRLLLTGQSGRAPDDRAWAFDLGVEDAGLSQYQPDYILPIRELRPDFTASPMVMYLKSRRIRAVRATPLGDVYDPYFNRAFRHFCSHQHTPPRPEPSGYHLGVRHGGIAYLAHPVFSIYRAYGAVALKYFVAKVLRQLLDGGPAIESNLPSSARVTLMRQAEHRRFVLHVLHAVPMPRGGPMTLSGGTTFAAGARIEVVEELLPLRNVEIALRLPAPCRRVTLEPEGKEIPIERRGERIIVRLDEVTCHRMVVFHE